MSSRSFSSPSASIFCGGSATSNNARVALLTPASGACADSTTATRRVKGLRCSSSPLGSGLALRKRSNASRTSVGVQGLEDFGLEDLVLEDLGLEDLRFDGLDFGDFGCFAKCLGDDFVLAF